MASKPSHKKRSSGQHKPDILGDKLDRLKQKFALDLQDKALALHEAMARAEGTAWAAEELEQLLRLVHSLAGSASGFSFKEVSEKAGDLEHDLYSLRDRLAPVPAFIQSVRYKGDVLLHVMREVKRPQVAA